jgi:hypothetical protein
MPPCRVYNQAETSLDRDHRRSKCLHQCSICRCHSTGTSRVRTTNRATPAATASTGCTIGSSRRTGSSAGRRGRADKCGTKCTRPARCWRVGVPWSRSITGAVMLTVGRSSCPVTGRPARPSRTIRCRCRVGGARWRDHRQVLNGILWKLLTGAPWRDLPERYGPWKTAHASGCGCRPQTAPNSPSPRSFSGSDELQDTP